MTKIFKHNIYAGNKIRMICLILVMALLSEIVPSEILTSISYAKSKKNEGTATLRIISTTDLHGKSTRFSYDTASYSDGSLSQIATVIKQKKKEVKQGTSLLVDSGDTIYGLGSNTLSSGYIKGSEYMYDMMKGIGYDAYTAGNHDFNFGYTYLKKAVSKAKLDDKYIVANIVSAKTGKPVFKTNKIIKKTVKTSKGKKKKIRIGVTGVVTTDLGDNSSWKGYIEVKDLTESVENEVEKLKKKKADVIVVLAHSGIGPYDETEDMAPNVGYQLCFIKGVDVVCAGHTHVNYPSTTSAAADTYNFPHVSKKTGFINGTILVQEADHGKAVGVSDLKLTFKNGKVKVKPKSADIINITSDIKEDAQALAIDQKFLNKYHNLYLKSLAKIEGSVDDYFGMIEDNALIQIANEAKISYGKRWVADNAPEYADLPVIASTSYSLTGDAGADSYISEDDEVNMESLLRVQQWAREFVRVYRMTGAQLRECLEWQASMFSDVNNPDIDKHTDESLKNISLESGAIPVVSSSWRSWTGYTIFDGVEYTIDLSQPPRYNKSGKTIINNSHRVQNITINGNSIPYNQEFIWVCYMKNNLWPPINQEITNQRLDSIKIHATEVIRDYVTEHGKASYLPTRPEQNWKLRFPAGNYIIKTSASADELVYGKPWYVETLATDNGYGYYEATFGSDYTRDVTGPLLVATALDTAVTGEPIYVDVTASDISGVSKIKMLYGEYAIDDDRWSEAATITDGGFEATLNGTYTVLAEDRLGNKSVRYVVITNYNPSVSIAPKVVTPSNTDTSVIGRASAGATVNVKTTYGSYSTVVDASGRFDCEVPNLKADSTVKISQIDAKGRISATTSVKVKRSGSNAVIISSITNKKAKLTGKLDDSKYCKVVAIRGDTVYIPKGEKKSYKKTSIYKNNKDKDIEPVKYKYNTKTKKFSLDIPNINAGQDISVYSYDWIERASYEQRFEVKNIAPNAPHIRKVVAEEKTVYGYVPAADVSGCKITVKSGKKKYYGTTDEQGYFAVRVKNLKSKRTVTVTASDVVDSKTRVSRAVLATPTGFKDLSDDYYDNVKINPVNTGDFVLKGKLKKNYGTKLYMLTDDARIRLNVNKKGVFKHKFSKPKSEGTVIGVISRNKDGTINTFRRITVKKK